MNETEKQKRILELMNEALKEMDFATELQMLSYKHKDRSARLRDKAVEMNKEMED